jgi:hypothetical protein
MSSRPRNAGVIRYSDLIPRLAACGIPYAENTWRCNTGVTSPLPLSLPMQRSVAATARTAPGVKSDRGMGTPSFELNLSHSAGQP